MKNIFCFLFMCCILHMNNLRAQTEIPYIPTKDNFGGAQISDLNNFIPNVGDYTLEVQGTANTEINIAFANIRYVPTATTTIRFTQKDGKVYVFENGLFKSVLIPAPAYTTTGNNLIGNPSFEDVASEFSTGRWKPAVWDTWNGGMPTWGSDVGKTNVREDANYRSHGLKSIIMHSDSRQLYQQLSANAIESGSDYLISYDYWTSSGSGNGGTTYRIILKENLTSDDFLNIQGHTTLNSGTGKTSYSTLLHIPENAPSSLLFILHRNESKVDWLDNLKMVKITPSAKGITGVSSALYLRDQAYAPGNLTLVSGDYIDMTEKIINPGFSNNTEGWTITASGSKISTTEKGGGLIPGSQNHLQFWVGSGGTNGKLSQVLTGLPNGKHTVKASIASSFSGDVYLYANTGKTKVTSGNNRVYEATGIVFDGTLEIGLEIATSGSPTIDVDDFVLHYLGIDQDGYLQILQSKLDEAQVIVSKIEENDASLPGYHNLSEFEVTIETAQNAASGNSEVIRTAIERLNEVITEYQAIQDAYKPLFDSFESLETLLGISAYQPQISFEQAIQEAKDMYASTTDKRAQIPAQIEKLKAKSDLLIRHKELGDAIASTTVFLNETNYAGSTIFANAISTAQSVYNTPESNDLDAVLKTLLIARNVYYNSQYTLPGVQQTVSWVDTSLDGSEKFVLRVNGKPFYMTNIQVRLDKLYGYEGWNDEQLEAVIKRAADDGFNTVSIPVLWREVEPQKDFFDWAILDKYMEWCKKYNLKMELLWFSWSSGGRVQWLWNYGDRKELRTPDYVCSADGKSEFNMLRTSWEYSLDWRDTNLRNREKDVLGKIMEHIAVWDANNGNSQTVIGLQLGNEATNHGGNSATDKEIIDYYHHVGGAVKESKYVTWTRLNCISWQTSGRTSANESRRSSGGTNIDFVGIDIYGTNASKVKGNMDGQLSDNGKNYKMIMEIDAKDSSSPIYQMAALAGDKAFDYYNMGFIDGNGLYSNSSSVNNGKTLVERDHINLVRQRNKILNQVNQDIALKSHGKNLYVYNYAGNSTSTETGIENIGFTPDAANTQAIAIRRSASQIVLLSTLGGTFTLPASLDVVSVSKGYFNADNQWVNQEAVETSGTTIIEMPQTSAVLVELKDDMAKYNELSGIIKNPSFENGTYNNGKYTVPNDWKLEGTINSADVQLKSGNAAHGTYRYFIWGTSGSSIDFYQDIILPKGEYIVKAALKPNAQASSYLYAKVGSEDAVRTAAAGSWSTWGTTGVSFIVPEAGSTVRVGVNSAEAVMADYFQLFVKEAEAEETCTVNLSFPPAAISLKGAVITGKNEVIKNRDFIIEFTLTPVFKQHTLVVRVDGEDIIPEQTAEGYRLTVPKIVKDHEVEITFVLSQTSVPYFEPKDDFGGSVVTNANTFVPNANSFTLQVEGQAGQEIRISYLGVAYTPEETTKVRFVQQDGIVYVYEGNKYKKALLALPQYTIDDKNLLRNPGFEDVGEQMENGKWKAESWDVLTEDKTTAWQAGSSTSVRENASYCSEGAKTLIMHTNARYLTQQIGTDALKPDKHYRLTYDYWTSSGSNNGGITYKLILGTVSCGSDLLETSAHTTAASATDKYSFETTFLTPQSMPATPWFTLYRDVSKVDWIDNFKLNEVIIKAMGITGATTAIYLAEGTFAPEDLNLEGKYIDMTGLIINPGFSDGLNGWSISANGSKISTGEKGNGLIPGSQNHLQFWVESNGITGKLSQLVTGIPNGRYIMKSSIVPTFNGNINLYAGLEKTDIVSGDNKVHEVTGIVFDGTLEIGLEMEATGSPLIDIDDFVLHCYGEATTGDYYNLLPKMIALAETLYETENPKEGSYLASLRSKLGSTITVAKTLVSEPSLATEEIITTLNSLKHDMTDFQNSFASYLPLKEAIDAFRKLVDDTPLINKTIFDQTIADAQAVYDHAENQTDNIEAAISALNVYIKMYFWAYRALQTTVTNAEKLHDNSDYPSKDTFKAAIDNAKEFMVNPDWENIRAAIQTLKAAQAAYLAGRNQGEWWVTIKNGALWKDDRGKTVQAHGAGFLQVGDTWYMIGEDRETAKWNPDINMYSSKDFTNWKFEGKIVANGSHDYTYPDGSVGKLGGNRMIERPKLLYCENTGQYVIWCHWEAGNYGASEAAVFYSDHITGPYKMHWAGRPMNVKSRDCNVFQDSDGKAYFVSTTNENRDLGMFELSEDYLSAVKHTQILTGKGREAPALVRINDRYHMLSSACTGWDPNQCQYNNSTSLTSGWSGATNLNNKISYDTQAASILTIGSTYLYVGDRWQDPDLAESKTIIFPIQFSGTNCTFGYSDVFDINLVTGEIRTTDTSSERIPRNNWVVIDQSSQESGNEATKAIDGNGGTFWHTRWSSPAGVAPHHITVDMGVNQEVSGFLAIPRTDNDTNGLIRKFMLYISNDNVTWSAVAGGAWLPYSGEIYFPKVTARYFKLVALEGTHASISELYMLRNTQEYTQRTLTPYYQIDGGAWTSSSEINIKPGSTVKFGPGGGGAGSWAMEGPNSMRAGTKEVTLTNVNEDHSGVYTTYYLDVYNQISSMSYRLHVKPDPVTSTWKPQGNSTDWTLAANWSNGVPGEITRVTIPESTSYPVLTKETAVNTIHFEAGAELGRQDLLTYDKAFVDYDFSKGDRSIHFRMLSVPLMEVFPGDFTFGGQPDTYIQTLQADQNGRGKWIALSGGNSSALTLGTGIALSLDPDKDANKGLRLSGGILRLPFFDEASGVEPEVHPNHTYSAGVSIFSNPYGAGEYNVTRTDNAYRLAGSNVIVNPNFGQSAGNVIALVGNPFMTTIDFSRLQTDNETLIKNSYQIWTKEGEQEGYAGYGPDGNWGLILEPELDNLIAPLQGFVVERNGAETGSLNFDIQNIAADKSGKLRKSAVLGNKIDIVAKNKKASVRTFIARRAGGSVQFSDRDARKLINSLTNVPEIYTLKPSDEGMVAVGANIYDGTEVEYPIGLATSYSGEMTFAFSGMNNCDSKIAFVDKVLNKTIDLSGLNSYDYTFSYTPVTKGKEVLAADNRFSLRLTSATSGIIDDLNSPRSFTIYSQSGYIYAISNELPISDLKVYNLNGTMVYNKSKIEATSYKTAKGFNQGVYIVEIKTEKGIERKKIIITNQ